MKKILLGLGTMGVLAIPLVSIVACSEENKGNTATQDIAKNTDITNDEKDKVDDTTPHFKWSTREKQLDKNHSPYYVYDVVMTYKGNDYIFNDVKTNTRYTEGPYTDEVINAFEDNIVIRGGTNAASQATQPATESHGIENPSIYIK